MVFVIKVFRRLFLTNQIMIPDSIPISNKYVAAILLLQPTPYQTQHYFVEALKNNFVFGTVIIYHLNCFWQRCSNGKSERDRKSNAIDDFIERGGGQLYKDY